MNSKSKQYTKWCLVIDETEVSMPTKEHAVRLGNYLLSFNVPLQLMEVNTSIETQNGKVRIGDRTRTDYTDLLDPAPPQEEQTDDIK